MCVYKGEQERERGGGRMRVTNKQVLNKPQYSIHKDNIYTGSMWWSDAKKGRRSYCDRHLAYTTGL